MAHYDLEEQEQIDTLKTWWKMYGNLVTSVVVAASLGVVGWQGWNWYQRGQTTQAAAIYAVLEQAAAIGDAQKVKSAAGELAEKFGGTSYASLGALLAGKQSFETGDLKTAKSQFGWVAENGQDEMRDLARLRLVAVEIDEQAYEKALKELDAAHAPAFDARFQELKGDVFAAQGKKPEARSAYKAALGKMTGKQGAGRELLQQKLDNLGEAV
ncbi:MAG: tetratricopeptide repeat protein [Gammaproteobacteria bacterium]|nr:tetratricopeptide repeat protein [Gammaproteobacteria bacterium]MBU1601602.1 tetratricopeptide repeat protein [Gammaproteobacteria bacterium]MBU2434680.1 tetratricopeptide repeat protein [Gammaproteobacteria bacterium]MBU2447921.1 tetratricopeptide repeat protein [Gammaproteobacteria bacterium]